MTPLTFVPHDIERDLLFKLVATQAGSQVPLNGDTELDLVRKWLLNKAGYPAPSHGDEIIHLLRKVLTGQAGAQTALSNDSEDDLWRKIALNLGGQPRTNDEKRDLLVTILANDEAGEEEPPPPSFTAETAVFDGTNDSMRLIVAAVTGLADGKQGTLSVWVNFSGGDGVLQSIFNIATAVSSARVQIQKTATNRIRLACTGAIDVETTSTIVAGSGWVHLLFVWDVNGAPGAGFRKIYFNGVAQTISETAFTDATIDYAGSNYKNTVGGNGSSTAGNLVAAALAELWFDDTAVDNPALFYSGGHPIDLGADGSTPKGGTKPVFYFSRAGSGNTWATDSANGSNMTVTGALGSTTSP